ncbi:MAG: hypothetical protein HY901_15505, partial [Deltaproteobacteria bacterium]|nr:hypothetical protein [Deltaproteobacteria bacterium]
MRTEKRAMKTMATRSGIALSIAVLWALPGCAQILGFEDPILEVLDASMATDGGLDAGGECDETCTSQGAKSCSNGKFRSCEPDGQGCLSWSVEQACQSGFCASASQCGSCHNDCTSKGATECSEGKIKSCVADADGCLSWSTPQPCGSGSCQGAVCANCSNACAA